MRGLFTLTWKDREAAYAMKIYLESTTGLEFEPQCSICTGRSGAVVELGAGNGFLGLKMAQILSSRLEQHDNQVRTLVLTDLEAVCPLLERNCLKGFLKATESASVDLFVQPLEWGNLDQGWRLADRLAPKGPSGTPDPTAALLTHIVCSDLVRGNTSPLLLAS
jgi:Lysine methyltransferase